MLLQDVVDYVAISYYYAIARLMPIFFFTICFHFAAAAAMLMPRFRRFFRYIIFFSPRLLLRLIIFASRLHTMRLSDAATLFRLPRQLPPPAHAEMRFEPSPLFCRAAAAFSLPLPRLISSSAR